MLRFLCILWLTALGLCQIFDLSELQWTLKNENGSIAIPATIPSQAHIDLLRAGIITEPLLEINDFTERWVVEDNWTYTADLSSLRKVLDTSFSKTLLVFYGLDTIANITFAGHPVAWVNNQFRQYVFDVSNMMNSAQHGNNNLTIAFESAWSYGLNVSTSPKSQKFPEGNGVFGEFSGVFPWIRKVASDFGWDWGPAFVPTGIYKAAYLVSLPEKNTTASPVFIEERSIDIFKSGENFTVPPVQSADWIVNVTLALRSAASFDSASLFLSIPSLGLTSSRFHLPSIPASVIEPTWVTVLWSIPDHIPKRWYPHNLGIPQLYNLDGIISLPHSPNVTFTVKTGFRTIRLMQSPYTDEEVQQRGITPGDNYHFEINGQAFYVKGSNLVPFDPFYSRVRTDQVRWILESSKQAGINMIRVWGGGHYQPSSSSISGGVYDFYGLCDELGILAWSELEFSDALYPNDTLSLQNIEPEVRQNVRRINEHPSNAQWAGGNEIEGIARGAGGFYLDQFVSLFGGFLHDLVVSETRSVAYTDCSTTNGVISLDPYVLRLSNETPGYIYGNSERYNYAAEAAFDYSTYPSSRFVNEFGFHSMPSFYSWEEVLTSPQDFSFNSTVVAGRDHHPPANGLAFPNPNAFQGQSEMTEAVQMWLPTPATDDSNQTFAQWCWSTQVFQSMTIESEIAWYRRGAGKAENNLGAIVWQLNDIWQGASWATIEYSGRWKVLQYGQARIFSPVIIYPFWTASNETLEVVVTSDLWDPVHGIAALTWYNWKGEILHSSQHEFTTPALNNSLVFNATGLGDILPNGTQANDVWLLVNVTATINGSTVSNEQYFTPTSLANASLIDPQINVMWIDNSTLVLSAHGGVAPWTWVDHPLGTIGYFVDAHTNVPSNGFYLIPGVARTLNFVLNTNLSTSSLDPSNFVVRSLWNNTHSTSSQNVAPRFTAQ